MAAETTQDELAELAARFTAQRTRLHAIAQRVLGSPWSAEDALQETWLRLQRADVAAIENLEAWLTTVLSRVCIDLLRRRDETWGPEQWAEEEKETVADGEGDPEGAMMRVEDLALAMHVILDELGPLERLSLVLHDVFALPYDQIAPVVERTPTAARQLASRARARLRGVDIAAAREQRDDAITAFLAAARDGDFGSLLQLLDPEIEVRSDEAAVSLAEVGAEQGAPLLAPRLTGRDAVARAFLGRAEATQLVDLDGVPSAAYIAEGTVHAVYVIAFRDDRIVRVDVIAEPDLLAGIRPTVTAPGQEP